MSIEYERDEFRYTVADVDKIRAQMLGVEPGLAHMTDEEVIVSSIMVAVLGAVDRVLQLVTSDVQMTAPLRVALIRQSYSAMVGLGLIENATSTERELAEQAAGAVYAHAIECGKNPMEFIARAAGAGPDSFPGPLPSGLND